MLLFANLIPQANANNSVVDLSESAASQAREMERRAWQAVDQAKNAAARARDIAIQARNLKKLGSSSIEYDIGRFFGQVRNGEPNGLGIFYYDTGSRYEGEFVDGFFEGYGVLYFQDGDEWHGDRYEGQFSQDGAYGVGVYQFLAQGTGSGDRYAGEFNDWSFEHFGVYFYLRDDEWHGTTSAGEFSDGMNEGYGVVEYGGSNTLAGDRYEGEMQNDLANGFGIYMASDGSKTCAYWNDDEPDPTRSVLIAADGALVATGDGGQGGSSSSGGGSSTIVIAELEVPEIPTETEEIVLGGSSGNSSSGSGNSSDIAIDEAVIDDLPIEGEEIVVSSIDGDPDLESVTEEPRITPALEIGIYESGEVNEQVRLAQEMLNNLGYDISFVDGVMGTNTSDAIIAFQDEVGLPITGTVDETLIYALRTAISLTRRIGGLGSDLAPAAPSPDLELWATGTAFVVSPTGDMVTNYHVIEGCEEVRVDEFGQVSIEAFDVDNDLALLKARTDAPLEVAVFRSMPKVSRGEAIVVIGFPLHGTLSSFGNVTDGMISALSGFNDDFREYQFSAPIQPGNSGGPLLDRSGHVIGVVSSELVSESAEDVPQNVNFAIKSSIVEAFLGAYGVDFSVMPSDESLDVSEIATEAEDHTFLVECWGDPEDY